MTEQDDVPEVRVSPERIREIEAKALRKLKHPSRQRKLREILEQTDNRPPVTSDEDLCSRLEKVIQEQKEKQSK